MNGLDRRPQTGPRQDAWWRDAGAWQRVTRMWMRLVAAVSLASLALAGCGTGAREWVATELRGGSCQEQVDQSDPNETKFLVCAGVGGYALRVRQVEAGRQSLDVVDASGQVMPLNFQDHVTRGMNALGEKAEWRMAGGIPVGLMVKVELRDDPGDPEKVRRVVWVVAKLKAACLTQLSMDLELARRAADSAQDMPCLEKLNS